MGKAVGDDLVLREQRGPVAVLSFNRPDRLNAWNDALEDAYFKALDACEADDTIRAIVVTGSGRGFCAGADLSELERAGNNAALAPRSRRRSYPLSIRKPLIAAINGPAAGLGLVEALYCDLRFCAPEAKLTTAFVRRGLIAEYGISWLLVRAVGQGRALDLLLSGRVVLGREAHAIGLVERLAEPAVLVEDAVAYARELAEQCSPASMAIIKEQVHRDLQRDFDAAFDDAERLLAQSFRRPDVREGVASYLERRPPVFPPLSASG